MFVKLEQNGNAVVGAYVDDLLVTATSNEKVDQFFGDMQVLELKDLGEVSKYFGMRVARSDNFDYALDQTSTISELLERFRLGSANALRAPILKTLPSAEDSVLPIEGDSAIDQPSVQQFESLVGSLQWIAQCTRLDITFAVHRVTRRTHAPTLQDWKLAKKIPQYLSGTKDLKLTLTNDGGAKFPVRIHCYSDADFAGDTDDRKLVSAAVVQVNGVLVE